MDSRKQKLVDKLWKSSEVMVTKDEDGLEEWTAFGAVVLLIGWVSVFILLAVMIGGF